MLGNVLCANAFRVQSVKRVIIALDDIFQIVDGESLLDVVSARRIIENLYEDGTILWWEVAPIDLCNQSSCDTNDLALLSLPQRNHPVNHFQRCPSDQSIVDHGSICKIQCIGIIKGLLDIEKQSETLNKSANIPEVGVIVAQQLLGNSSRDLHPNARDPSVYIPFRNRNPSRTAPPRRVS